MGNILMLGMTLPEVLLKYSDLSVSTNLACSVYTWALFGIPAENFAHCFIIISTFENGSSLHIFLYILYTFSDLKFHFVVCSNVSLIHSLAVTVFDILDN